VEAWGVAPPPSPQVGEGLSERTPATRSAIDTNARPRLISIRSEHPPQSVASAAGAPVRSKARAELHVEQARFESCRRGSRHPFARRTSPSRRRSPARDASGSHRRDASAAARAAIARRWSFCSIGGDSAARSHVTAAGRSATREPILRLVLRARGVADMDRRGPNGATSSPGQQRRHDCHRRRRLEDETQVDQRAWRRTAPVLGARGFALRRCGLARQRSSPRPREQRKPCTRRCGSGRKRQARDLHAESAIRQRSKDLKSR